MMMLLLCLLNLWHTGWSLCLPLHVNVTGVLYRQTGNLREQSASRQQLLSVVSLHIHLWPFQSDKMSTGLWGLCVTGISSLLPWPMQCYQLHYSPQSFDHQFVSILLLLVIWADHVGQISHGFHHNLNTYASSWNRNALPSLSGFHNLSLTHFYASMIVISLLLSTVQSCSILFSKRALGW